MAFARFVAARSGAVAGGDAGGQSWGDRARVRALQNGWEALGAEFFPQADHESTRFQRDTCFAASLLWALWHLPPSTTVPSGRPVSIWVFGARDSMEGRLAKGGHWQLLAKAFPSLQWELIFVGPEISDSGEWQADGGEGAIRSKAFKLKGEEWIARAKAAPDFLVCFNTGIGTLAVGLTRHWLRTIAALLSTDTPVLFTCFNQQEVKGEGLLLRQLFQATLLVEPFENIFGCSMANRSGRAELCNSSEGEEGQLHNAFMWWAKGSRLSAEEQLEVALVRAPQLLRELTASFAMQGAWKDWLEALRHARREVAEVALESLDAALDHPEVVRLLSKITKRIAAALVDFTRRHGHHAQAVSCVERMLLGRVKSSLLSTSPDVEISDEELLDSVREMVQQEYSELALDACSQVTDKCQDLAQSGHSLEQG